MSEDAEAAVLRELRALRADVARIEARLPAQLATVAEAAKMMRVSVPTIRRWIKDERIAYVRRGRSIRIDLSKLRPIDAEEIAKLARAARAA